MFKDKDKQVHVLMSCREANTDAFFIWVDCWHLDWQVSSVAQIYNALSQVFSTAEHVTLRHEVHSRSCEEHNDVDRIERRNLLGSFSNAKTLRVEVGLVEELCRFLRLGNREPPLELLPELQELTHFGSRDDGDAFTSFIDSFQNAACPVTLVGPGPRPRPLKPRTTRLSYQRAAKLGITWILEPGSYSHFTEELIYLLGLHPSPVSPTTRMNM